MTCLLVLVPKEVMNCLLVLVPKEVMTCLIVLVPQRSHDMCTCTCAKEKP